MAYSLQIIDNFYNNPEEVRQFALKQDYGVEGNYPGRRTVPMITSSTKQYIEEHLSPVHGKIYWPTSVDSYCGSFQYTTAEDRTWIHADNNTKWAGTALFTGAATTFHIGTKAADTLSHTIAKMAAHDLGVDSLGADNASGGTGGDADIDADLTDATKAAGMITAVDNAIKLVSTERGKLGAVSNRLSSTISNLDQVGVNLSASKGRIADSDFAAETGNLAKNQILQQAATAMLAQANASKGTVLTLIQNLLGDLI